MATEKRLKKQNFLAKDPSTAISGIILFIANMMKYYYLSNNGGRVGMGIYSCLLFFNFLFLFIFVKTMFEVTKNGINYRKERGRYKNAKQLIRTNCVISIIAGLLIDLIFLIFSNVICNKLFDFGSFGILAYIFILLANPLILLCFTAFAAFRTYSYNIPIGISVIIFSITDLLLSLLFGHLFWKMGIPHAELLHNENVNYAFVATGVSFGYFASVVLTSLFVIYILINFSHSIRTNNSNEYGKSKETFSDQIRGFFTVLFPPLFQYALLVAPFVVTMILYFKLNYWLSKDVILAPGEFLSNSFATIFDSFIVWLILPSLLTILLGNYSKDYLAKVYERNDRYHIGMRLILSLKSFLCVPALFYVFGSLVASSYSTKIYGVELTGVKLYFLIISLLLGIMILLNYYAKGLNKQSAVFISSIISAVLEIGFAYLFLSKDLSIYSILKASLIYFIVYCISLFMLIKKYFVYRKHRIRHLVYPLVALAIYGLFIFIFMFIGNLIGVIPAVIISFILGIIIHSLALVLSGCITPSETQELPQGNLIILLSNLLGLKQASKK